MTSTLTPRAPVRRFVPAAFRGPVLAAGPAAAPDAPRARQPALVLAIILICQLMIVLDVSIVITALPKIHRALHFSATGLSWVQSAYTLTFGGLLLLGARAGDLLGRRRMLMFGIALFTTASLAGGLAQSGAWLLGARAVQGIGAAIAAPSTLALLTSTFPEGDGRTRAVAAYSTVVAAGGSVGLVLGGMLTDWVSWRWGLFINVPIGLALIWLAPRFLPETERRSGRFDLTGALTSTLGMTALVYGFVRAASVGWGDPGTLAAFSASATLLTAFVLTERRAQQPITPLRLFASRERNGAYLARLLLVSGNFSAFFFLTQYLQGVSGFSPLQAGLAFLPMTVMMFAMGRVMPRLMPRVGSMRLLVAGLLLAGIGLAWLSRVSDATQFFPGIAVPMALFGTGTGIAFTPLTAAGLVGVEPGDAGAASGLLNVAQQLGGSLGLGILVTVFAAAGRSAAAHPLALATPRIEARHELAHAVATTLSGSAVFLALALAVVIVTMRRVAVPVPAVTVVAARPPLQMIARSASRGPARTTSSGHSSREPSAACRRRPEGPHVRS
jgi:EmrB/QacA subfamily drug resistance transporter